MSPRPGNARRRLSRRWPATLAERLADSTAIPRPFTDAAYENVLTELAGTPIRLVPLPAAIAETASGLTGMTMRLAGKHYVFYRTDTSPVHQLHIIHHELFHVLEGHPGLPANDRLVKDTLAELLRPELPHLSGDLIGHLVGRDCTLANSADRHERDAERFAVTMAQRLGLTGPPAADGAPETQADKLRRMLSDGRP